MKKLSAYFIFTFLLIFTFSLPFMSSIVKDSVISGTELCLNELIPSLFPFLFFSSLISSYGANAISKLFSPFVCPLFNISKSACPAVVAGILGGFPAGAVIAAELYRENKISKSEAERLPIFCNNAGLMFTAVTLGSCHFSSFRLGLLIYFFHIFSSIILGILTRSGSEKNCFSKVQQEECMFTPFPKAFTSALSKSLYSIARICGNFIIFRVLSGVFSLFFKDGLVKNFIFGLLEVTGGVLSMPATKNGTLLSLFLLSFNGICVHMQTLSTFAPLNLSIRKYILGKIFCAFLSLLLMYTAFPGNSFYESNFPPMTFFIILAIIPLLLLIPSIKKNVSDVV